MGASLSRGRLNEGRSQKSKGAGIVPPSPAQTTFKWRINGFSSLLDKDEGLTYSRVFEITGLNWYLKLNPRDRKSGDKNEYVSLKLELARACVRSSTVVEASFKFLIYDQAYGKHQEHLVRHNFQTASTSSGTSCMIPLTTLNKHSSGFLMGDSCVFGVEFIKVATTKANDTSETLFVQKANNTFSDPEVYTWNIEDFFALKSMDNSPEFEIGGHKWSIIIYPSGAANNGNYLSLYLEAKMLDTLHQNSANLVELSICVKDQETGKHRKLTGRCQFSKKSTKWGWDKFISLENFKDSSNGYLVKTKCCIEVEVAIVGSSKME
ncbi:probable inactive serine/threonine-protein kinase fnkC [Brachypodium distachyon]|uniref:MATH domain-containing protein n=1 Tax=Brachypodium distachyon TaxID=15368 RepID=I1I4Q8_BRADI|nr:probable inactive serine/threonine-protein kinase fnkC [Brachypodium distachyon]PNT67552.1 hypothetical protein BRADI_3g28877v3 [Brachypodium distachyon]|eukprot:XP_024316147.1 probable inactive serine/threonine-protein kinase fnkC [Brachypodium distachyon]